MRPGNLTKRRQREHWRPHGDYTTRYARFWRPLRSPEFMAITNSERVGKALDVLKDGLRPFVERELKASYKTRWLETAKPSFPDWQQPGKTREGLDWDSHAILQVMCDLWG